MTKDEIKGGINMCEVLDKIEQQGIKKGIGQGVERVFVTMLNKGYSVEEAQEVTGLSKDDISKILKESPKVNI